MSEIKPVAWYTWQGEIQFRSGCPDSWVGNAYPVYDQQAIDTLRAEVERLRAKTGCTMGVGAGDGQLFVHGDYDSIKAAQALVFRAERAEDEAEALRKDAERYRLLCELIDAGDQGADDAVGDAYALGAGALDLFLDEQPRAPAIDAAKQAAD